MTTKGGRRLYIYPFERHGHHDDGNETRLYPLRVRSGARKQIPQDPRFRWMGILDFDLDEAVRGSSQAPGQRVK